MKKHLFILLNLFITMSAFGQDLPFEFSTTDISENIVWYQIKLKGSYIFADNSGKLACTTSKISVGEGSSLWAFVKIKKDKFHILNKATQKELGGNINETWSVRLTSDGKNFSYKTKGGVSTFTTSSFWEYVLVPTKSGVEFEYASSNGYTPVEIIRIGTETEIKEARQLEIEQERIEKARQDSIAEVRRIEQEKRREQERLEAERIQKEREEQAKAWEEYLNSLKAKDFVGKWVDTRIYGEPVTYIFNANGTMSMTMHKGNRTNLGRYNCWVDIDITISNIKWSYANKKLKITTSSACGVITKISTDLSNISAADKARCNADIVKLKNQFTNKVRANLSYNSGSYELKNYNKDSFVMRNTTDGTTLSVERK